jgi:hypothetical protein
MVRFDDMLNPPKQLKVKKKRKSKKDVLDI